MQADFQATSALYWLSALVTALIDVVFVLLLAWRIRPARFRQLGRALTAVGVVFWCSMWTWALWSDTWNLAYRYVFADWTRWVVPPTFGLLFGVAVLITWWLSLRLPGNPVVNFCVMGGPVSLPGHLRAIYGMRMFEKVPLLQNVSPASALVFGVFEFIFYWSFILTVAALLKGGWEWWK